MHVKDGAIVKENLPLQEIQTTLSVNFDQGRAPSSVSEFKKLFSQIGISTDGLKGKKAYLERYNQYLQKKEENDEDTEDMEEEELQLDEKNFTEIDFEGVEYLEDEDSGEIYSTSHELVGKWTEDCDDIIWSNESFRLSHESKKD